MLNLKAESRCHDFLTSWENQWQVSLKIALRLGRFWQDRPSGESQTASVADSRKPPNVYIAHAGIEPGTQGVLNMQVDSEPFGARAFCIYVLKKVLLQSTPVYSPFVYSHII